MRSRGCACDALGYPCAESDCACEGDCDSCDDTIRGVWCRVCGDFMPGEEPDDQRGDGKAVCYRCYGGAS